MAGAATGNAGGENMAHFPLLMDEAPRCPRCGGRRLTVTIYMSSAVVSPPKASTGQALPGGRSS
jgi:hypothetical protein